MSAHCSICLDDYKGKRVVPIKCQYCPSHACRGCQQAFLLQSYEDPHCMTCKQGWSSEFMAANFPLSFRSGTLRKWRRKVLLEREKALLPAMQIFVEYRRNYTRFQEEMTTLRAEFGSPYARATNPVEVEAMSKTVSYRYAMMRDKREKACERYKESISRITELKKQLGVEAARQIVNELRVLNVQKTEAELDEAVKERKKKLIIESEERRALRRESDELGKIYMAISEAFKPVETEFNELNIKLLTATRNYWNNIQLYNEEKAGDQKREFIMKCADENCRGFLSSAYKCGTCEKWTCSQCLVIIGKEKDGEHTCNPDTVETAKMIKAETRPCPKCGTRIFKVDGCDQMWCTVDGCHTAFSWNTGHVITGKIHNPHYYEWLRRNGGGAAPAREVGDIPCGGLPPIHQLFAALRPDCIPLEIKGAFSETHRNLRELIDMRLYDFPARPPALANKDIDVDYLMNNMTEEDWQRQLELAEAKFMRKKEIGQVLQTLATAGSDLMNHIVNQSAAMEPEVYAVWLATTAKDELEQLRAFGNETLKGLAKRDRIAVPQFEECWKWKAMRAIYKTQKVKAEPTAIVESAGTLA